ncbi:MAG: substrate-binding domain-containing protein [Planctomycetota bacterium]
MVVAACCGVMSCWWMISGCFSPDSLGDDVDHARNSESASKPDRRPADQGAIVVGVCASANEAVRQCVESAMDRDPLLSDVDIQMNVAGSQILAKQSIHGWSPDILLLADQRTMDQVAACVKIQQRQVFCQNELVLVARKSLAGRVRSLQDLQHHPSARLLIGGSGVPLGDASQQLLDRKGCWESLNSEGRILRGGDAAQTRLQFLHAGGSAAILYATDANAMDASEIVQQFSDDRPRYFIARVADPAGEPNPAADRFLAFLTGPHGREVFRQKGFVVLNSRTQQTRPEQSEAEVEESND